MPGTLLEANVDVVGQHVGQGRAELEEVGHRCVSRQGLGDKYEQRWYFQGGR